MTRRADQHDLVAEERLEGDAAVAASRADDAELELSLRDPVDDGLRVGDRQSHAHVRMLFLELAEQERDDRAARARRSAELERARDRPFIIGVELFEQVLLGGEHTLSRCVETSPGLGRLDPATRAVEELPPEALLERADLQADGRLSDAEPLRRLGEALALDDGAERGKLTRVHKHSLCNPEPGGAGSTILAWPQRRSRATLSSCGSRS